MNSSGPSAKLRSVDGRQVNWLMFSFVSNPISSSEIYVHLSTVEIAAARAVQAIQALPKARMQNALIEGPNVEPSNTYVSIQVDYAMRGW